MLKCADSGKTNALSILVSYEFLTPGVYNSPLLSWGLSEVKKLGLSLQSFYDDFKDAIVTGTKRPRFP